MLVLLVDKVGSGVLIDELITNLKFSYSIKNGVPIQYFDLDAFIDTMFYDHLSRLGRVERDNVRNVRMEYVEFLRSCFGEKYLQGVLTSAIAEQCVPTPILLVVKRENLPVDKNIFDKVVYLVREGSSKNEIVEGNVFKTSQEAGLYDAIPRR